MAVSRASELQKAFGASGLTGVFVERLGWDAPGGRKETVEVDDREVVAELVASLKGFRIYAVPVAERPTRQWMRRVDAALGELSPERMEIFQSPDAWFWHWPRRTSNGTTVFEAVETSADSLPLFLAQRLSGLEFTIQEIRRGLTIVDVRDRVHGHFDASPVTKKFYDRFQKEQKALSSAIEGVSSEDAQGYSTTLMNRLMFIYFMQKKEFLNDDPRYLENTLAAVRELRGPDQFYSFYRDALLPLFFDRLNDRAGSIADREIDQILGDVPYVNGGIFGRTDLEVEFAGSLQVPDSAFEKVLSFFAEFDWHLDTRPTGKDNEINPEVIGYIFEQYINFTASGKKENGAYYTPHDVTAYMVAQTLVPRIFDELDDFDSALKLLRADPDRYIQPAMLHGWDGESQSWASVSDELTACWKGDPIGWPMLDSAAPDPAVNLPSETWVEAFHRRERVESLRQRIREREVREVNDLVTENLNGQLLLTDTIDQLDDTASVKRLFDRVTQLSVFDPTCGSGAFLFAALEVLEDVYAHLIDEARSMAGVPDADEVLHQVDQQPSQRYFIRKHIAIRNLYGTDLMPGAIETAKLRIFLALAACVDTRDELRPLPDLDFNLKVGNLLVGFRDADDAQDRLGVDLVSKSYLDGLAPRIREHSLLYRRFVGSIEVEDGSDSPLKSELSSSQNELRAVCNSIYAQIAGVDTENLASWTKNTQPFHWFCEFPEVIDRGGFDVVIGNPPYVKRAEVAGYSVQGFATANAPDIYAACHERSLSLTRPSGRHAFIVMSSLAFGGRFSTLREVISARGCNEWWSTYGKIPSPLFAGVKVRNTILVLGPGNRKFTTRHHIHTSGQRQWLFAAMEYSECRRDGGAWPVRGGVATKALEAIGSLPLEKGSTSSSVTVFLRRSATYWFPALLGSVPVLNPDWSIYQDPDEVLQRAVLSDTEVKEDVIAVLGGKIAYLWWCATGDDFNVNPRETESPRALAQRAKSQSGWSVARDSVLKAAREVTYVSLNKRYFFNVRWSKIRDHTDRLDLLCLEALGAGIDEWRALNVLYRQMMRSSGDSAKGRYVTQDEYSRVLGWS